jgi:hypothetical protein
MPTQHLAQTPSGRLRHPNGRCSFPTGKPDREHLLESATWHKYVNGQKILLFSCPQHCLPSLQPEPAQKHLVQAQQRQQE